VKHSIIVGHCGCSKALKRGNICGFRFALALLADCASAELFQVGFFRCSVSAELHRGWFFIPQDHFRTEKQSIRGNYRSTVAHESLANTLLAAGGTPISGMRL